VRFYGRVKLSPLKTKEGKLARFALTAGARRIAAKGHELLER
jgi:hypothetical protein